MKFLNEIDGWEQNNRFIRTYQNEWVVNTKEYAHVKRKLPTGLILFHEGWLCTITVQNNDIHDRSSMFFCYEGQIQDHDMSANISQE